MLPQALGATSSDERRVQPDRSESVARRVDQLGVEVDGEHAFIAEPMRQELGVVAGADLQDSVPAMDIERFEHPSHEARFRAAGGFRTRRHGAATDLVSSLG